MKFVLEGLNLGSKPAPGELALVQGLVNTIDIEDGSDELTTAQQLAAWLTRHGLADEGLELQERDRRLFIDVREAFRALLLANNGVPLTKDALDTLAQAAADSPLTFTFDSRGRGALTPEATGIHRALANLFAVTYTAVIDGTWPRLKACPNDRCHWAFFDGSKNRSGTWCSMAVCGSRIKAKTYRQRHAS